MSSTPTREHRALSPIGAVKDGLQKMRPQFASMLPAHISAERFERVVMTAINLNPELLAADKRSLFNACLRAAQDGLLPDGKEGAFVIFKDRTGAKLVTWMPMVFGIIKKIRQSGEVESIGARIVYQKEIDEKRFEYVIADGMEKLTHEPMLWGDRGNKVLVYAYARFKNSGMIEYEPLHRNDVEKRRQASRAKDSGPWVQWEEEMWLKTAIRKLSKRLPLSAELMRTLERDDDPTEFEALKQAATQNVTAALEQFSGETDADDRNDEERIEYARQYATAAAEELKADTSLKTRADIEEFRDRVFMIVDDLGIGAEGDALKRGFQTAYLEKLKMLEAKSKEVML